MGKIVGHLAHALDRAFRRLDDAARPRHQGLRRAGELVAGMAGALGQRVGFRLQRLGGLLRLGGERGELGAHRGGALAVAFGERVGARRRLLDGGGELGHLLGEHAGGIGGAVLQRGGRVVERLAARGGEPVDRGGLVSEPGGGSIESLGLGGELLQQPVDARGRLLGGGGERRAAGFQPLGRGAEPPHRPFRRGGDGIAALAQAGLERRRRPCGHGPR